MVNPHSGETSNLHAAIPGPHTEYGDSRPAVADAAAFERPNGDTALPDPHVLAASRV